MEQFSQFLTYVQNQPVTFVMLTFVIGGGAAYISGRAIALTWRPRLQLALYMLLLGLVVRFFHFALFKGPLLSFTFYVMDTLVLLLMAFAGYQITRAKQITTHYNWLFKRNTPLSWSEK